MIGADFKLKWRYVLAHAMVVALANLLVLYPFPFAPTVLTWAAFVSPISFFITDLCNRRHGVRATRRMVCASFIVAVLGSLLTAEYRIAIASGAAFLVAQSVDAIIFDQLRGRVWWVAPTVSGVVASVVDSTIFFVSAFYRSNTPWISWAFADYAIKLSMIFVILPLYGSIVFRTSGLSPTTVTEGEDA
ncbi:TPA: queuosine precursor transporter [Burkholderia cenocepacia]|uniref:queuosine precursor transporter n=1 Tax=Burkholderia cepacia complex TaxID=87882 RepID=UPI0009B24AAA|nr:queuosine precursor transporter [Burkholderia cenocepacia]MCW3689323.1 queuosine precursor transporter [Burkholderia cenocepacia]MEB2610617.1 queuosine precursor transporter [Burkholderia cenocepacia]QUN38854.1 queuosine precursor transporter [Burkholderia cenocepacia]QUO29246.1 queuosine precursor transporter [Burkholderia cenocepacia]